MEILSLRLGTILEQPGNAADQDLLNLCVSDLLLPNTKSVS
jgi:hypothetical protein